MDTITQTLPRVETKELDNLDLNKRQEMLARYLRIHPFTPETLLSNIFNVSSTQIRRDKRAIVDAGIDWGNNLATGGFMVECANKLSIMEEIIQDDYAIFKRQQQEAKGGKRHISIPLKVRLFREVKEKLETINDVPLYHKYMQWEIKMKNEGLG